MSVRAFWAEEEKKMLAVIHWAAPLGVKRMRANAVMADCGTYPWLWYRVGEMWREYEKDCVDATKKLK
jgi:hypothetical protein